MKCTHKVVIYDDNSKVVWQYVGTLEHCYDSMLVISCDYTFFEGYTWELTYNNV